MDFTKAHFAAPLVDTDKVPYASTWNVEVPQYTGAPVITELTLPLTGLESANDGFRGPIPFGIYSFDSGVSWNSFTTTVRDVNNLNVQATMGYVFNNDLAKLAVRVDGTVGVGTTIPIRVKFGFIQQPDLYLTLDDLGNALPLYQQKTAFDSRTPVPKIAKTFQVTGTGSTLTLPHLQSQIPDVRVGATNTAVFITTGLTGPNSIELDNISVDATNVYIPLSSTTSIYVIIIYLPE